MGLITFMLAKAIIEGVTNTMSKNGCAIVGGAAAGAATGAVIGGGIGAVGGAITPLKFKPTIYHSSNALISILL